MLRDFLKYRVSVLLCVAASAGAASGAGPAFELIGPHPAATLIPYKAIHSLTPFEGRIYAGYGDWNDIPPVVVTSFDPASRKFHLEHSIGSDSIGVMRVLGSTLWIPHMDPVHGEDFEELSRRTNGVWQEMSAFDSLHVFDCAQSSGGALFLAGAADSQAVLGRSMDNGKTWSSLVTDFNQGRFYWCFVLNDRVYVQTGSVPVDGTALTPSNTLARYPYLYKPSTVETATGGASYTLALAALQPGFDFSSSTALLLFDGVTVKTLLPAARDFVVSGGFAYVLDNRPGIMKAPLTEGATLRFEDLSATGIPANASSLCEDGGNFFVGTRDGRLLGARADGGAVTAVETVNDVPPSYGRGLSFSGTELAAGVPDAMVGNLPMAGEVLICGEPLAERPRWNALAGISTPQPRLSGWFGRKVALRDDLLAVIESGADSFYNARGSAARLRLYTRAGDSWIPGVVRAIPWANSAAFSESGQWLVVGVGGGSRTGQVFKITRDALGAPVLQDAGRVNPSFASGYEPVTKVAFLGERLIASFAGDPSREGGPGAVGMWREDETAPGKFRTVPAWSDRDLTRSRFGYALAADGEWIAVGAPRADEEGHRNSGRVHLYRIGGNGLPAAAGRLTCPEPQDFGDFGGALALKGSTLLVGAPGLHDGADGFQNGAVFIYRLEGDTWVPAGKMTRPQNSIRRFGTEVAIGDVWMAASSRASLPGTAALDSLAFMRRPDPGTAFDKWLAGRAPGLAKPSLTDDTDSDGYPLLLEYVLGLDPRRGDFPPANPFGAGSLSWGGDTAEVEYAFPAGDPRLMVKVTGSGDLGEWALSPLPAEDLGAAEGISRWRQKFPAAARQFFRLEADYKR